MSNDVRVRQLVDQLLDSDSTPEEVCGAYPELLPEVRLRWQRLRRLRGDLDALLPPEGSEPSLDDGALPQIPGYRVESFLGRGGMGVVFRAWHHRLNRPVALKMILAGAYAGPRERERFQREAEAAAGLRHPNVVQIHAVGDAEGRPYFTMELVDGGSLAQSLIGTPLAVDRAAELIGTLASAVQAAHAAGIIHRDLKPANVLLSTDGTPKVSDFGLARRMSDETGLTLTGVALGTPSYMAPEQAGGNADAVGPTADVYSLGAIMYELLTGRPPFRGETSAETVRQLLTHDPVPVARLNPRVPRDLETICMKCLQKGPRLRYATAGELAEDLERFRRGEAIAARPDGIVRRWARRVRRRPVSSTVVAAVFVLAVTVGGGALWLASERAADVRAAEDDLREMADFRERSKWSEARAALGRAKARLGEQGSNELRSRIDRAHVELTLIAKLDAARLIGVQTVGGKHALDRAYDAYATALEEAEMLFPGDTAQMVADRIKRSNVSMALVNAFDGWAGLSTTVERQAQITLIASLADPDANGWRKRMQDPELQDDKAALERVANDIENSPANDPRVSMFMLFADRCRQAGVDPSPMLKRIHRSQPNDFWLNLRLAAEAETAKKHEEAVQYYHSAVVLRPDAALAHNNLATVLRRFRGRESEAIEYRKEACRLDPHSQNFRINLVDDLTLFKRHAEAIPHTRAALQVEPNSAFLHEVLARNLEAMNEDDEALAEHRRALKCEPAFFPAQSGLRTFFVNRGQPENALAAWNEALALKPPNHDAWYGYAELCLYLGREEDYRAARRALLSRFANETSPPVAERVSRACLLRPASGDELKQAATLADRAAAADRATFSTSLEYFQFAQGLADFRRGRFDSAAATMRGSASKVLGPAPKLVLAMTLHQQGEIEKARKTLTEAVAGHDWSPANVRDQNGWFYHSLRREADQMIGGDSKR